MTNTLLIFHRELRDQLRDRRTLFTIAVLPLLLYPLMGMAFLQVAQFRHEQPSTVRILGGTDLPGESALIGGRHFRQEYCNVSEARQMHLEVDSPQAESVSAELARQQAREWVRQGRYDVVVYFPPDFAERVAPPAETSTAEKVEETSPAAATVITVPQPEIFVDNASEKSRAALVRVERVLERYRQALVRRNLRANLVPASAIEPFMLKGIDVAQEPQLRTAAWSKILPFIMFVWALTGAFYPAIDVCAGEKERGTLETLLVSPASRRDIVWGKLLTVMTFSIATALLNLASFGLTGGLVLPHLQASSSAGFASPPLALIVWMVIALIPVAALFSAISLAVATFARSSKEGQYYLMPVLAISLPLLTLPLMPSVQLDLGTSLIPLTGILLLLRSLTENQFHEAWPYIVPVCGVTACCCWFATRWAVSQFNSESALFRECERWNPGSWLRALVHDRPATQTFGQAIACGLLLLILRFFTGLQAAAPETWEQFATIQSISLIVWLAVPAILFAVVLTRRPARSLLLSPVPWHHVLTAVLLAAALHPLGMCLAQAVHTLYPPAEEVVAQMERVQTLLSSAPHLASILLVLALLPAVCEELAFRGFVFGGLRQTGRPWLAIVVSSVFFGVAHGILQQSLTATVLGLVLGYLAYRTSSLLPCIAFHTVYNSLTFVMCLKMPLWLTTMPVLRTYFAVDSPVGQFYQPVTLAMAILVSGVLLWRLHREGTSCLTPAATRVRDTLGRGMEALAGQPVQMRLHESS